MFFWNMANILIDARYKGIYDDGGALINIGLVEQISYCPSSKKNLLLLYDSRITEKTYVEFGYEDALCPCG